MTKEEKENFIDNLMVEYALEGRSEEACRSIIEEAIDWATQQTLQRVEEMVKLSVKTDIQYTYNDDTYQEGYEQCLSDVSQLLSKLKEMK